MTENAIKKALECSRLHSELADRIMSGEITENKVSDLTDQEKLLVQSAWDCIQPFEVRDIVAQQQETINRKNEQIESLIAGQETLQKSLAEKSAEVEKFKKGNDFKKSQIDGLKILLKRADEIKSEAVKEFAERLKEKAFTHERPFEANEDKFIKFVAVESIDNLVKEMVGEK